MATAGMPRLSAAMASCRLHDEQLPQSPMPETMASAALSSPSSSAGAGRLASGLRRRMTSRTPKRVAQQRLQVIVEAGGADLRVVE